MKDENLRPLNGLKKNDRLAYGDGGGDGDDDEACDDGYYSLMLDLD